MSSSDASALRLNLTPEQRRKIELLAHQQQISAEEAVLRAVEHALATEEKPSLFPVGTPFHGLDDLLVNLGEGPADLSTNRAYLDELGA